MKIRLAAAIAALAFSAAAHADPTAVIASPGITFAEYSGSAPVGQGAVDSDTLYFIDEQTGALGKSYYIFFDPLADLSISATITFDSAVTGVYFEKATLDGSNATYGAAGITYGTSFLIGLEARPDSFSIVGNVLTINWDASDPGDHIRVFTTVTPVPEPETYALFLAGLCATGYIAKRRSRA